ncbi:MAG: putative toxin-antitoxin system toxin component, PIN family [Desulfohalobiaceae bacterium]|nr:putative toxin-antitoxin system toxin component, PIN family [Desulfohalobiaceae bacterium]
MSRPVVVDTNVLVSGLLSREPDSPLSAILDGMINGSLPFLLSPWLLAEYRAVLLRPRVQHYHGLSVREVDAILTEIAANGIWREPIESEPAPDPGDDHLWRLLSAVPSSILVTGDRLLLQSPPGNVSVISPRSYLELQR